MDRPRLEEAIRHAQGEWSKIGRTLTVTRHDPAGNADIAAAEAILGVPLSPSHRNFLLITNGMDLSLPATDAAPASSIAIAPVEEIAFLSGRIRARADHELPVPPYVFCAKTGYGDFCLMDPRRSRSVEYPVVDAFAEESIRWSTAAIVAASFATWINDVFYREPSTDVYIGLCFWQP